MDTTTRNQDLQSWKIVVVKNKNFGSSSISGIQWENTTGRQPFSPCDSQQKCPSKHSPITPLKFLRCFTSTFFLRNFWRFPFKEKHPFQVNDIRLGRVWLVFLLKTIQFMGVNPWVLLHQKNGGVQETKSSAWATLKVSCISTPLMTFVRLLRNWRMKTQGGNELKPTSTTMKGSSPAIKT